MHTLALLLLCISWSGRGQVDAAGELRHVSSGGVVYASAPRERGAYAVGAVNGQSHYGYNTGTDTNIAKVEVRRADGSVVGSYRYFDPNGKQVVRSYIADSNGFRVLGNDLPISPDTPASQVQGAPALTGAFEGTSEFDIPPPLIPGSQHHQQSQNIQQVQSRHTQKQDTLIQQQQQEYQRQQEQLEQQREELRIQQQKLEALQRQLEAQQQKIQQQYSVQETQIVPQQQVPSQQFSSSLQEHHPYRRQRPNTLTGGVTSPYFYYKDHLNYDFPAGFAYPGLPVTKPQPVRRGCGHGNDEPGCGHNYIIGRAR